MRRLLFGIVIGMTICLGSSGAFAQQELDHPSDKFGEFEQKLNASKKTGGDQAAPAGAPLGANPLGPASALPLGKQAPAAAVSAGAGPATPQTPEELQAMMEQESADQQKKIEEQTFEIALKQLLPLKPEQIRTTLDRFRESRQAAETPLANPEPRSEVQTASLDPSAPPLTAKMAPGRVSTISFLDATGAPWPIQDMSWGGPFAIQAPETGGNLVQITPTSAHGAGNMSIRLIDMISPLTLNLTTGIDWVHYRLDIRIPKPGPLAKTPLIAYGGLKTVAGKDEQLVSVLDGTPPTGAEKLKVDGVDARTSAYQMSGRIYLRTPLTLLSPGWDASVSSADGMNVYAFNSAPVVLLSDEGRMVKAHIASDEVTTP